MAGQAENGWIDCSCLSSDTRERGRHKIVYLLSYGMAIFMIDGCIYHDLFVADC